MLFMLVTMVLGVFATFAVMLTGAPVEDFAGNATLAPADAKVTSNPHEPDSDVTPLDTAA